MTEGTFTLEDAAQMLKPSEPETGNPVTKGSREQSTISFPYSPLDDCEKIAVAIHDLGGVPCTRDQIAAKMQLESASGNFGNKLSAARIFGLIDAANGKIKLTPRGFDIIDSDRGRSTAAKIDAFLSAPLYKRVYEEFRNTQLPPRPLGLESAFVGFGVAEKQKQRARQIFDRSAQYAGFFHGGENRLVKPVVPASQHIDGPESPLATGVEKAEKVTSEGDQRGNKQHMLIEGLFEEIPPVGEAWSIADQAKWLRAATQIFGLLYKSKDDSEISISLRESKAPRE